MQLSHFDSQHKKIYLKESFYRIFHVRNYRFLKTEMEDCLGQSTTGRTKEAGPTKNVILSHML